MLNHKGKESKEANLKTRSETLTLVPTGGYKRKLEKAGTGFLCGAVTVTSLSLSWGVCMVRLASCPLVTQNGKNMPRQFLSHQLGRSNENIGEL